MLKRILSLPLRFFGVDLLRPRPDHRGPRSRILSLEQLEDRVVPNASSTGIALLTPSNTTNVQDPQAYVSPTGRMVIVYTDNTAKDGSGQGILAHVYDNQGGAVHTPVTNPFVVNTATSGDQADAKVAGDAAGDFIVVWDDLPNSRVEAREFDTGGAPLTAEFTVGSANLDAGITTQVAGSPRVGMDANGNFIIAWQQIDGAGDTHVVYQRYSANDIPIGSVADLTPTAGHSFTLNGFRENPQGAFVFVWSDNAAPTTFSYQEFASNGTTEFGAQTLALSASPPGVSTVDDVALAQSGLIYILYEDDSGATTTNVFVQKIVLSGAKFGPPVQVFTSDATMDIPDIYNQGPGAIAVDTSSGPDVGNVAITYGVVNTTGGNVSYAGATIPAGEEFGFAQRFDSSVSSLQGPFQITPGQVLNPRLALLDDQDFVATWVPPGSPNSVKAQRFAAATTTVTSITGTPPLSTSATSVTWTVTFANLVGGLTASNFQLVAGGSNTLSPAPMITAVTPVGDGPAGVQWTVTASTGTSGHGTLQLQMINSTGTTAPTTVTGLPVSGDTFTIEHVTMSPTSLSPAPMVGTSFSQVITGSGAPGGQYNWTVSAGMLPDGLSLSTNGPSGSTTIQGTPTTPGAYDFTLKATDAANSAFSGTQHYTGTVNPAPIVVTNNGLTITQDGTLPITTANLQASEIGVTDHTKLTFTVNTPPTQGNLLKNNVALGVNGTFTQADIDNGLIKYQSTGATTAPDAFTFTVTDTNSQSVGPRTFSITVTAPLTTTNNGMTITQNGTLPVTMSELNTTSGDTPAHITYTLTTEPVGSLKKNGTTLLQNDTFTQADINNGIITYQNTGAAPDSFAFNVADTTGGSGSGTFHITVTAPLTTTNNGLIITQNSTLPITMSALNTTSGDTPAHITYTVTTATTNGSLKKNGTALGVNGTFTQADVNNGIITYQNTGGTSDGFAFNVADTTGGSGSGTFAISVNPPLVLANNGLTITQDGTLPITTTNLQASETGLSNHTRLTFTVNTAPTQGNLKKNGTTLGAGGAFTQADIDNGLITYQSTGASTVADSFAFTVTDTTGGNSGQQTFAITVTAPLTTTNNGMTITQQGTLPVTMSALNTTSGDTPAQITYTITAATTHGTLKKNGTALGVNGTFTQADINNGIITYQNTGAAPDSFAFNVADTTGGSGSGTFHITVTAPLTTTNNGLTVPQGSTTPIPMSALNTTSGDTPAQITYTITAAPTNGAVKKSGTTVGVSGTFTQADINNGIITYLNTGGTSDSFAFNVADTTGGSGSGVFHIAVTAPAPVVTAPPDTALGDLAAHQTYTVSAAFDSNGVLTEYVVYSNGLMWVYQFTAKGETGSLVGGGVSTVHAYRDPNGAVGVDVVFRNGTARKFDSTTPLGGLALSAPGNIIDAAEAYDRFGNRQLDVTYLDASGAFHTIESMTTASTGVTTTSEIKVAGTIAVIVHPFADAAGRMGQDVSYFTSFTTGSATEYDSFGSRSLADPPTGAAFANRAWSVDGSAFVLDVIYSTTLGFEFTQTGHRQLP